MVPVRSFAGIARARLMDGKAADAAAVLTSFKKSRRFVLIRISPLYGLPVAVIACGSLVAHCCACMRFQFRFGDLLFIRGKQLMKGAVDRTPFRQRFVGTDENRGEDFDYRATKLVKIAFQEPSSRW